MPRGAIQKHDLRFGLALSLLDLDHDVDVEVMRAVVKVE